MSFTVDVQYMYKNRRTPGKKQIREWAEAVLGRFRDTAEVTIRIVDEEESRHLNETWRKAKGATNVLSFPAGGAAPPGSDLLGDIVICAPVAKREAKQQHKSFDAHFAHMVVHGMLHLLGYDHTTDQDTALMESIETDILENLGYGNPYL